MSQKGDKASDEVVPKVENTHEHQKGDRSSSAEKVSTGYKNLVTKRSVPWSLAVKLGGRLKNRSGSLQTRSWLRNLEMSTWRVWLVLKAKKCPGKYLYGGPVQSLDNKHSMLSFTFSCNMPFAHISGGSRWHTSNSLQAVLFPLITV